MNAAQKSECPAATGQNANQNTKQLDFGTSIASSKEDVVRKVVLALGDHSVHQVFVGGFSVCKNKSCHFTHNENLSLNFRNGCGAQVKHLKPTALPKQLLLEVILKEMPGTACISKAARFDVAKIEVYITNFKAIGGPQVPVVFDVWGEE